MRLILVFFLMSPSIAATELYLPWVPQNETFQTTIIVNNHETETVSVTLSATRTPAETDSITVEILPFDSFQALAQELFPLLGSGPGSVVKITSEAVKLTASCLIGAITTDSGFSPAQMNAIPRTSASDKLGYHHTPVRFGKSSALVTVNLGDRATEAEFQLFSRTKHLGTFRHTLVPGQVFARQTIDMFADPEGILFATVESDQPMIGAIFVFNDQQEPSLVSAQAIAAIPDPFNTISDLRMNSSTMRVGETKLVEARGRFLQDGQWRSANHLVTWENTTPSIIQLVTEGPDAGQVTALKSGVGKFFATANGEKEWANIWVISRELQFSRGFRCAFSHNSCETFLDLTVPADLSLRKEVDFTEANPHTIEFFRLVGDQSPLKVKRITITSSKDTFTARVSGLNEGDVIQPGQRVDFTVDVARFGGTFTIVELEIEMETQGVILEYQNIVTAK